MTEGEMIFVKDLPLDDLYIIVKWPFVQLLMEYEWFRPECLSHQAFDDQEYLDSAYFVPISRFLEAQADITHLKPGESLLP